MKSTKFPRAKPPRLRVAEIKTLVRHRDGYRCTECGMTAREHVRRFGRTLDVHRLTPGSRYTFKGCVALCSPCHSTKPKSKRGKAAVTIVDLKAPADWIDELDRVAALVGLSRSAYIRLACNERMSRDRRERGEVT